MKQENKFNSYIYINKNIIKRLNDLGITNGKEILLFCEILKLSMDDDCIASNDYFSDLLCTSDRNIRKYLQHLKETNLITMHEQKEGMKETTRYIYPQYEIINIDELIPYTKDSKNQGYIYIIKVDNYYKIGRTLDPKRRMGEYTKLMKKPDIISLVFCNNYKQIEKDLHKMFFYRNTNGEWFTLTEEELNKAIQYLKDKEIKSENY